MSERQASPPRGCAVPTGCVRSASCRAADRRPVNHLEAAADICRVPTGVSKLHNGGVKLSAPRVLLGQQAQHQSATQLAAGVGPLVGGW